MRFGPILSPIGQLLPGEGAYVTFYAVGALEWGSMVAGDFSTPLPTLEMTVPSPDSQTIRFQTSDGPFGPLVSAFYDVRAPSFGRGFPSLFFKQHQV